MLKYLTIPIIALGLFACGNAKNVSEEASVKTPTKGETQVVDVQPIPSDTITVWVNSSLCNMNNGGENTIGLMTQEGVNYPGIDNWECVYPRINGFVFEPGYVCQLKTISETTQGRPQLRMVEMVTKMMDMDYYRLHDIWALTHTNGTPVDVSATRPNIEINLKIMKVMGKGMCNQFFGKIESYNAKEIKFGPIAGTKKMCPEIGEERAFFEALGKTQSFKIENLTLTFFDAAQNELLRFQKVD